MGRVVCSAARNTVLRGVINNLNPINTARKSEGAYKKLLYHLEKYYPLFADHWIKGHIR